MIRLTLLVLLALRPVAAEPTPPGIDAARRHRAEHAPVILDEFARLLSIPNVARDAENIRRNADFIVEAFARRGVTLEPLEVRGAPPLIVGDIRVPGATRTLGIYVHYDGQPVDADRWTHDPWTATLLTAAIEAGGVPRPMPGAGDEIDPEWRVYARAAGDDKAPLIALLAAIDALRASGLQPTSNIKFMFEGEEEASSLHLREYFARYGDRLEADVWLICDGPVHQSRRPQLVFGVRGVTSMEITVYGANRYLHSGHYGNWAPNPAHRLARLLATMKDDAGRVTIEGFYDTVEPLSDAERSSLATVPQVDVALRRQFGLAATEADNAPLVDRLLLPSLNLRGFVSGTVGPTARNVIPSAATAAIDIRLVKGNDPSAMQDLVERHVRAQGYHVVREEPSDAIRRAHPRLARVRRGGGYRAVRAPMDQPIVRQLARTVEAAAAQPIVLMPSLGGSLPLYLFEEMLEAPTIIVPIANHDNNQHGPDENIRLANLWYGIDLMAGILTMHDVGDQ
ncbi:MAG: M20/M25/M40 family metallo-hydrolase [Planctomycetota bacterium]|jgi:acetylornithine deacetylase/succinyl-diaminopimelate desuccinylase-like protein